MQSRGRSFLTPLPPPRVRDYKYDNLAWPSEASQIPTRKSCLRSAKLLSLTMIPIYHGDHITKSPTFIFFSAFSLLRTKRLIPVHQCTMHIESFAQLFFQNTLLSQFWWNLSFITFWLKSSRLMSFSCHFSFFILVEKSYGKWKYYV